jgi:bacteriorhodopsin
MIQDKWVSRTVYASLAIQLLTTGISLDGLRYTLDPNDAILHDILLLEAFVQVVEAVFYIWVILALRKLKIMASRRYLDWVITTPTMLLTTIIFMEYLRTKDTGTPLTFKGFLRDHQANILQIFAYNWGMLLCGFLAEIGVLDPKIAIPLGFVFFGLSFHLIYDQYARHTPTGTHLCTFLVGVWGLYGMAAYLGPRPKNTMYNILDIVSKNFYGLYLYHYIRGVGTPNGIDVLSRFRVSSEDRT